MSAIAGEAAVWLALYILLGCLLWRYLRLQQAQISFLHPGWVLSGAWALYALPIPALIVFAPDLLADISPAFETHFDAANFSTLCTWYLLTGLGFLAVQLLITSTQSSQKSTVPAPPQIGVGLIVIGVVAIAMASYHFSKVGGIRQFLLLERKDAFAELGRSTGFFSRYHFFVHCFFGFASVAFLHPAASATSRRVLLLGYLLYAAYSLALGTRLDTLVILTGMLAVLAFYNFKSFRLTLRRLRLMALVLIPLLGAFAAVRQPLRTALAGEEVGSVEIRGADFFPAEPVTGYLPGLMLLKFGSDRYLESPVLKLMPTSLIRPFGFDKPDTLSDQATRLTRGRWQSAVFTVSLPVDAGLSYSTWAVIPYSALVYLGMFALCRSLASGGPLLLGCYSVVYMQLFHVVRVEGGNWFARMWQAGLIACLCALVLAVSARLVSLSHKRA